MQRFPYLGHGVGLRPRYYEAFASGGARTDFVEAISENFMGRGGRPLAVLEAVRERLPVALHGVSLSVGSTDPLNERYLERLAELVRRIQPAIVSDHLSWGSHGGRYAHDLWPLPLNEASLDHVAERVLRVQDRLGRPLVLENVSSYVAFAASTIDEWDFLAELARRTDCGILLDVNNVFVSAKNHGFDPVTYIGAMPPAQVAQIHLAGHSVRDGYLLDTHDAPVCDAVWDLYRVALRHVGAVTTLIEWDDHLPELPELLAQSKKASLIAADELRPLTRRQPARTTVAVNHRPAKPEAPEVSELLEEYAHVAR